jgi:hypothetical protein
VDPVARTVILVGLALVVLGVVLWAAPSIPLLGKLPGDIRIERPGFRFYFPITTCLLLSGVLWAVSWLVGRLR